MDKYKFTAKVAKSLDAVGRQITGHRHSELLNKAGYTTDRDTPFVGGQGVFRLISTAYHRRENLGHQRDADSIATVFVDRNGNHAYK